LIGILWGISFKSFESNESWKLFLMVGLCGGFTTFSAFTLEGIGLIREQRLALFFSYVTASVVLGLLATYIGMRLTR
jgi:CrcB protein